MAAPTRMLVRGLLRRCPRCGGGRLFPGWLRMAPRCPRCGVAFERDEGFFLGAFVINFGVVLGVLAAYIGVAVGLTLPDPPVVPLVAGGLGIAVVVPILFYPFSRTVWSAVDLIMKPLAPEEASAADAAVATPAERPSP
ncbi:MAG TPA: DUF983 domain-containing protein [Acidimicrobiales bacterium]|nr:DUF983 domain-containing protein [Acidimicrobiales bacterium]